MERDTPASPDADNIGPGAAPEIEIEIGTGRSVYARTVDAWERFPLTRMATAVPKTAEFLLRSFARRDRANFEGQPVPDVTPSIALAVAMDEAMLALAKGPSRYPRRETYSRVGTEIAAAHELFDSRGWLDEPGTYHQTPPALETPAIERSSRPGLRYERLLFHSGYLPHEDEPGRARWLGYEHNHTAYAWLLRHDDPPATRRPWLVCVHGFAMGTPFIDFPAFRARDLFEMGMNIAIAVLPLHGPRRLSKVNGDAFMDLDLMNTIHGVTQAVWDIRRLISWIRTQNPTRIGAYGMSLGAFCAALLSTLEDIDLVIAGVPFADLPELFRRHSPKAVVRDAKSARILGRLTNEVHRVVSPLVAPSRVSGRASYVFAGLGDRMATPRQGYMLASHWDGPETLWYSGNHVGFLWSSEVQRFIRRALETNNFGTAPENVPDRNSLLDAESA